MLKKKKREKRKEGEWRYLQIKQGSDTQRARPRHAHKGRVTEMKRKTIKAGEKRKKRRRGMGKTK